MPQPQQSQATVTTIEDWTLLREAVKRLEGALPRALYAYRTDIEAITTFVPRLLDAYAELWQNAMGMMEAWETWQASKDQVYVPDASDMIQLKSEGSL